MKSTLFASTMAAALASTSFGQVEVLLVDQCCGPMNTSYVNEVLTFDHSANYGYAEWYITVPSDTWVSFDFDWNDEYYGVAIFDSGTGGSSVFSVIQYEWEIKNQPDAWSGSFFLPQGTYVVQFNECEGVIDFGFEPESEGSCCVNSGCTLTKETACNELGGAWAENGSCDDCEPVADDCPADVDGDGSIGFSDILIILNDWGTCP